MRYTVEGFNQAYALSLTKEIEQGGKVKTIRIDCTDLLILRWFVDFYPNMMKMEIGGEEYAWLNYKAVLNDLPILRVNKHTLAARLQKLVSLGVLKHKNVKESGNFSYYGFGSNFDGLQKNETDTLMQKNVQGMQENGQGMQKNVQPLYDKTDNPYAKKRTTNNSSIIYNSSIRDDAYVAGKPRNAPADFTTKKFVKPTVEEVKAYCAERKNNINAQYFVDYYDSNGWKVGQNPMQDWQATIRKWENNGYKQNGVSTNATAENDHAPVKYDESGGYWDKNGDYWV